MLEIVKSMTLNGVSTIEGQPVAYLNATISTDGNGSSHINQSIANKELYEANKTQVRKDMDQFKDLFYQLEDELGGQNNEIKSSNVSE